MNLKFITLVIQIPQISSGKHKIGNDFFTYLRNYY